MDPRRVIKDPYLRSIRDDFGLRRFVNSDPDWRREFFLAIDRARTLYRGLLHGEEPPDSLIITALLVGLEQDGRLNDHIRKRSEPEDRQDQEKWRGWHQAAAGTILQAYVDACVSGEWPEGGGQ
jgi:hypothetical protein